MTFELHEHIVQHLSCTVEEDVTVLSEQIFTSLPSSAYGEALRQALPHIVRRVLATAPRGDTDSGLGHTLIGTHVAHTEVGQSPDGEGQVNLDTQSTASLPVGQNVRNSRVAIFRRNRFRLSVWVGQQLYRQILDCTREDLEFAAAESQRQADANQARADQYSRLAKVMVERNAAKVADLTDAEIEAALNGGDDQ